MMISTIKVSLTLSIILLASVPTNYTIISYLSEKPLGSQTVLDTIHKDLIITNLAALLVIGMRYVFKMIAINFDHVNYYYFVIAVSLSLYMELYQICLHGYCLG
jgi:hypothetical protein